MNRIQFPNPYGYPLPSAERVRELVLNHISGKG